MKIILILTLLFTTIFSSIFAVGFHPASEILSGQFSSGDFTFDGRISMNNENTYTPLQIGQNDLDADSSSNSYYIVNSHPTNYTGIAMGQNEDNRSYIVWDPNNSHLTMGTKQKGISYSNTLILNEGNIGIKTTTPEAKLHIYTGNAASVKGIIIDSDGDSADSPFRIRTNIDPTLITDADTKFLIDGEGRVIINASGSAPTQGQIHINGNGGAGGGDAYISFYEGAEVNGHWSIGVKDVGNGFSISHAENIDTNPVFFIEDTTDDIGIGTITPTEKLHVIGNILASGTITPASDMRLKKNISNINYGLDEIKQLNSVNYYWKNKNLSEDKQIGFIAQEVEQIIPEVVLTQNTKEGYKSLNYMGLIPVLVNAIKEQEQSIEFLKQENENLTLRIELLENS